MKLEKVRVLSENSLNDLGKSLSAPLKSRSAFHQKKSEGRWTKFDCSRKKFERSQIKFSIYRNYIYRKKCKCSWKKYPVRNAKSISIPHSCRRRMRIILTCCFTRFDHSTWAISILITPLPVGAPTDSCTHGRGFGILLWREKLRWLPLQEWYFAFGTQVGIFLLDSMALFVLKMGSAIHCIWMARLF